jgi:hypothetical protein
MGWTRGNAHMCGHARTRGKARKRLRHLAGLVFVFQALATGLAPIAHAHTEAVNSERKVEAGHSNQCVPVHSETRCTLTTLSPQDHSSSRVLAPAATTRRMARPSTVSCILAHPIDPSCNGERAPPSL